MPTNQTEIEARTAKAITAIKSAFGTDDDEYGATAFVSHHLDELGASYWEQHCGSASPTPESVLEILVLRSHWGADDGVDEAGIEHFDFTLPDDVTNYVICVHFDECGDVDMITMES